MKKLKFFFLYFICLQASAQSTLIATQVKSYQVDRLDNVLYIDLKSNITKIESTRLKTNHYAALASGSPEILDATNPFAIMVFYPSFFLFRFIFDSIQNLFLVLQLNRSQLIFNILSAILIFLLFYCCFIFSISILNILVIYSIGSIILILIQTVYLLIKLMHHDRNSSKVLLH